MELKSSPRHSRRGFFRTANGRGLAEIIDFSPEQLSRNRTNISLGFAVLDEQDYTAQDTALYSFLADQIVALSGAADAARARMRV